MKMTPELAQAAAWDAGVRHFEASGRTKMDASDFAAMGAEYDRLRPLVAEGTPCATDGGAL
jgi:hypothetical protein